MKKSKLLAVMLGAVMIPTTLAVVGCGGGPALNLQGQGTQDNPYIIATAQDLNEITKLAAANANLTENKFFKLTADIGDATNPYQTTAEDFNAIFKGTLLGDSKTITMAGETALFDENEGTIQNLNIVGTVNADETEGLVGMLANTNAGTIKNVNIAGQMASTRGQASVLTSAESNGVGGLVGLNDTTGKIEGSYSEATIQAKVGGGGFAAINKGEIKTSYNAGTIGMARPTDATAWLSNTINYSVMGGIAGINFGSILASQNKSYVFAPALNTSAQDYVATMLGNDYIGGIVGYNKANATISECANAFGGSSSARNIVFGDEYVGSIAGANAGTIEYSVVTQNIGARAKFGGITSTNETTGTVKNCAVGANQARGTLLGSLADATECAAAEYWFIADTAVNSVYNSGDGRGAIPETANAYTNCSDGFTNSTTNKDLLAILNTGVSALETKWFINTDPGNADPSYQPIGTAVATLTTVTGDAANLKATVYGFSKLGGDSVDVQPNGNAPEGYTFAGWSLTQNGEILTEEQSLVITWTLTAGQNIVVYAVYTQNPVVE